jgi:hypothetical protein
LCFNLQGLNWVDVLRKDIRMPYQPPLHTNNFQENLCMEILGHDIQDIKIEVSKSTLPDVLVCGA